MKLIDHENTTIELLPGEGEHAAVLKITEHGEGFAAEFVLRPDDALALAAVLRTWARSRTAKAGMF